MVKLHQSHLLPRVAIILKDFYDADLLEEDVILAWAEKVCVRPCVSPWVSLLVCVSVRVYVYPFWFLHLLLLHK